MSASQDIRELESELENRRRDLREDAARISGKIEETKAKLSPTNFVRERAILVVGGALLLGLAIGYLVSRRKLPVEAVAQPAIEHLGQPVARRILSTAGKEAATRAVHG
jgi:uncharacterized protein YneF (UPF0154 family)